MYTKRIHALLNAIDAKYPRGSNEREETLDFVESVMALIPRCASATFNRSISLDLAKMQVSEKTYVGMESDLADSDKWLYQTMVEAIEKVNILCKTLNIDNLCDEPNIANIENICCNIVKEYFINRNK